MREAMKQSTSGNSTFFGEIEIEVCAILIDLPNLISESEWHHHRFPFGWVGRRRRSAIVKASPSPCRQRKSETQRLPKVNKVEATSPSTPLSFCLSESDDKSNQSLKINSKKRTREEWLEIIDGLTQSRESLRAEVEAAKSNYKKLYAHNLDLKAKKQELTSCPETENPHLGMNIRWNLGMKMDQHRHPITMFAHHQHQQFIMDQTLYESQISGSFQCPYGQRTSLLSPSNGVGMVNQMDPLGIPDLNLSAEETFGVGSPQSLDLSRVLIDNRFRAAEARRRRRFRIVEKKNSFAAIKLSRCR